ncbi:hypothetical protein NMG60_11026199 [Bertholletia excelsa]
MQLSDDLLAGDGTDGSAMERRQAILALQFRRSMESFASAMPQFHCSTDGDSNYLDAISRYGDGILIECGHSRQNKTELVGVGGTMNVAPMELVSNSNSPAIKRSFSLKSSCTKAAGEVGGSVSTENRASLYGGLDSKKRKELLVADDCEDKEPAQEAVQGEFSVPAKSNSETSSDNSKVSETQKSDYIHVRARRGEATDNHSLAERARRERINKKMKCLQDLVPGCEKVTGKLGMLDEIINYVQSLQSQVEFLSTKLASLYPRLDFKLDSFMKEFPAHVTGFPAQATALPSETDKLACLQFNQAQEATNPGIDFPINPTQFVAQRTPNTSAPLPTFYLDSSSFAQAEQISSWVDDPHTLHNTEFR